MKGCGQSNAKRNKGMIIKDKANCYRRWRHSLRTLAPNEDLGATWTGQVGKALFWGSLEFLCREL